MQYTRSTSSVPPHDAARGASGVAPETALDPCPTCPYRVRLEHAKTHFREQRALITQLQTCLDCYQRIGGRRFQEGEAWSLLVGSDTLSQLTILRRALAQRDATIARQASVIRALTSGTASPIPDDIIPEATL